VACMIVPVVAREVPDDVDLARLPAPGDRPAGMSTVDA
jgi:hypothetical protein